MCRGILDRPGPGLPRTLVFGQESIDHTLYIGCLCMRQIWCGHHEDRMAVRMLVKNTQIAREVEYSVSAFVRRIYRFITLFITGQFAHSNVCISCPNRMGKDRCVLFFDLLGGMPFSLR